MFEWWFTNVNGISAHLELFYASWLGCYVHCTYLFFVLFLKFFGTWLYDNKYYYPIQIIYQQIYLSQMGL